MKNDKSPLLAEVHKRARALAGLGAREYPVMDDYVLAMLEAAYSTRWRCWFERKRLRRAMEVRLSDGRAMTRVLRGRLQEDKIGADPFARQRVCNWCLRSLLQVGVKARRLDAVLAFACIPDALLLDQSKARRE